MIEIQKTDIFEKWFRKIKDGKTRHLINMYISRLSYGNFGDSKPGGKSMITKWDMADYIETAEDVITCLSTVMEEGEPSDVVNVIGAIARSKGMTELARQAGVSREALYTSLSEKGNPSFATVFNVLRAMGITLNVRQAKTAKFIIG